MPTPRKGESRKDYVSRCMGSEEMRAEFPKQDQRAAVCYSKYKKGGKKKSHKSGSIAKKMMEHKQ